MTRRVIRTPFSSGTKKLSHKDEFTKDNIAPFTKKQSSSKGQKSWEWFNNDKLRSNCWNIYSCTAMPVMRAQINGCATTSLDGVWTPATQQQQQTIAMAVIMADSLFVITLLLMSSC